LLNKSSIGLNISDKNKWRDASCPIKVIEYTALGKRVVSTNLDEVKNFRFPIIFLFSDDNDGDSLDAALRRALDNKKTYGVIANQVTDAYDWSLLVEQLLNLIPNDTVR